ncbi:TrkA-N domain protein [Thermodesulfatator indicus DSM 15286]|uniref:Trk system potassium uptake protein TrkA n=1 Tax=Thermodesulfatator indicus (strain DSM 15286 / JCM 11887 / CIR29812) TaxID=667014 RepID=F8AD74_THEID|nr:TrkA family potassium uptake protein [Thermodesulfatator indicus]AEH44806.1 TrkA-N domain protein [Thermodesulfatator indicus DSM 15286]
MNKKVIVIGLGKFGSNLAKTLAMEKVEVLGIDRNEKLVEDISQDISEAIVADATRKEVLKSIGVEEADYVVVAMSNLSASVLIVLYLRELKAKFILAKANDEDHARILRLLGADRVVIPEQDAALKEAQALITPNMVDFLPLLPEFLIARIDPPDEFVGHSLKELDLRRRYHVYILAIRKKHTSKIIILPPAEHVIEKDEELFVLGKKEYLEKLLPDTD